jgi:hypothetical protein
VLGDDLIVLDKLLHTLDMINIYTVMSKIACNFVWPPHTRAFTYFYNPLFREPSSFDPQERPLGLSFKPSQPHSLITAPPIVEHFSTNPKPENK